MTFRSELKRLLREQGLSQREFAQRCGKSPAWVSRILKGTLGLKSLDEVLKICEILRCSSEEATNLCKAYQGDEGAAAGNYEILLRPRKEEVDTDLLLVDPTIDVGAWKERGEPTVKGEFAVVGRGPRHEIDPQSLKQFNLRLGMAPERAPIASSQPPDEAGEREG